MSTTTTLTRPFAHIASAPYARTAIDDAKDAADVRIEATTSRGFMVRSRVALSGRGIAHITGQAYQLSDAAMTRVQAAHSVACDF